MDGDNQWVSLLQAHMRATPLTPYLEPVRYDCPRCAKHRDALRYTEITSLPPVRLTSPP
jgi:hypothetical protein